MKTINYCAMALTALAIQFGGWQNDAAAQSTNSYRGGFEYEDSGKVIELIPYGNPSDLDEFRQSLYRVQAVPEDYANSRSDDRMPYPEGPRNQEGPRNFSREANPYQGSSSRNEAYQSERLERRPYRSDRDRDLSDRANYPEFAQSRAQRPPRDNWSNRGERYGAYRQDFTNPDSQLARSEGRPHRGGCRGRCGSHGRGGDNFGTRENGDDPRFDAFQFEQTRPQQFPNNEANQAPSLKVLIP